MQFVAREDEVIYTFFVDFAIHTHAQAMLKVTHVMGNKSVARYGRVKSMRPF
jgi:hypothetical protein